MEIFLLYIILAGIFKGFGKAMRHSGDTFRPDK